MNRSVGRMSLRHAGSCNICSRGQRNSHLTTRMHSHGRVQSQMAEPEPTGWEVSSASALQQPHWRLQMPIPSQSQAIKAPIKKRLQDHTTLYQRPKALPFSQKLSWELTMSNWRLNTPIPTRSLAFKVLVTKRLREGTALYQQLKVLLFFQKLPWELMKSD